MNKTITLEVLTAGTLELSIPKKEINSLYQMILTGTQTYLKNMDTEMVGINDSIFLISKNSYLKDGYFTVNRREIHEKIAELHNS